MTIKLPQSPKSPSSIANQVASIEFIPEKKEEKPAIKQISKKNSKISEPQ
jgi:hypothetical protein|tara:strand:+ start:2744 stop:2893 length:150 start_codon:yes stop_codon:yes gene_type:complete